MIDAKVHTPSGAVEECYITELDNGECMGAHKQAHHTNPCKNYIRIVIYTVCMICTICLYHSVSEHFVSPDCRQARDPLHPT